MTLGTLAGGNETGASKQKPSQQFQYDLDVNLYAGAEIIEHFQNAWNQIQRQMDLNIETKQSIAKHIEEIDSQTKQLMLVGEKLNADLDSIILDIDKSLLEIEKEIQQSSTLLNGLHKAIIELNKQTIDENFKRRKDESKKKLDSMVSRRIEDLALYQAHLYSKQEKKEIEFLYERQMVFQQAFEEELRLYKEKGIILEPTISNSKTSSTKLEDISFDVSKDEENELEKFLQDD